MAVKNEYEWQPGDIGYFCAPFNDELYAYKLVKPSECKAVKNWWVAVFVENGHSCHVSTDDLYRTEAEAYDHHIQIEVERAEKLLQRYNENLMKIQQMRLKRVMKYGMDVDSYIRHS